MWVNVRVNVFVCVFSMYACALVHVYLRMVSWTHA